MGAGRSSGPKRPPFKNRHPRDALTILPVEPLKDELQWLRGHLHVYLLAGWANGCQRRAAAALQQRFTVRSFIYGASIAAVQAAGCRGRANNPRHAGEVLAFPHPQEQQFKTTAHLGSPFRARLALCSTQSRSALQRQAA
jgi:hypothetical protein